MFTVWILDIATRARVEIHGSYDTRVEANGIRKYLREKSILTELEVDEHAAAADCIFRVAPRGWQYV